MYKLSNLIIYIYICHQESFKIMCVQFSMTNHKAKTMSSDLTVEFFGTFHRRFELPKTRNSWGTKFCLPETNSFAPLAGCNYPPKNGVPRKPSSFRCGAVSGEQITLSPSFT